MLSNSIAYHKEIVGERSTDAAHFIIGFFFFLEKLPQPPSPSVATILISQLAIKSKVRPPAAKYLGLAEGSDAS